MSGKYYYLVSSLPFLSLADRTITKETFLAESLKWLSSGDFAALKEADIKNPGKSLPGIPALIDWNIFKSELDEALVGAREAVALNNPVEGAVGMAMVKPIFDEANPLLMEKKLAEVELDFIDSNFSRYFFDINWLILYYLKLQIIERLSIFNKDIGEKFFYELCEVEYEK